MKLLPFFPGVKDTKGGKKNHELLARGSKLAARYFLFFRPAVKNEVGERTRSDYKNKSTGKASDHSFMLQNAGL